MICFDQVHLKQYSFSLCCDRALLSQAGFSHCFETAVSIMRCDLSLGFASKDRNAEFRFSINGQICIYFRHYQDNIIVGRKIRNQPFILILQPNHFSVGFHSYWSGTVLKCSSCSIPSVENKLLHCVMLLFRSAEKDFLCNRQDDNFDANLMTNLMQISE